MTNQVSPGRLQQQQFHHHPSTTGGSRDNPMPHPEARHNDRATGICNISLPQYPNIPGVLGLMELPIADYLAIKDLCNVSETCRWGLYYQKKITRLRIKPSCPFSLKHILHHRGSGLLHLNLYGMSLGNEEARSLREVLVHGKSCRQLQSLMLVKSSMEDRILGSILEGVVVSCVLMLFDSLSIFV